MSSVWRARPVAASIASASSATRRIPRAVSSIGQPCEPTWTCSARSQGNERKASRILSRCSSRVTPNFEVEVAVLVAAMEPAPTLGLIRSPTTARLGRASRCRAQRSSSWKLSTLIRRPRSSASSISRAVFAGESNTIRSGGNPRPSACATSTADAHSAPNPMSRASASSGPSGFAFTARACSVPSGNASRIARRFARN